MEADRTEKFSPIARVMNRTMTAALQIPHFGYKDEVDMSALVRLRKQLKHQVGRTTVATRFWRFFDCCTADSEIRKSSITSM